MDYPEFLERLEKVRSEGWVTTHRASDTGVGKTLEDLLGIVENNVPGPDFELHELKSGRKKGSSMLTLFSRTPEPKGVIGDLVSTFGYPARKKGPPASAGRSVRLGDGPARTDLMVESRDYELHVTLDSLRTNSVGLRLQVADQKVSIENSKGVTAFYDPDYLRESFERKYGHALVYVLADNRGKGASEEFWYQSASLLSGFSFDGFLRSVEHGVVKLDIRVGHFPDGRPHDHGTGFRVFPRDLPRCFQSITPIMA